MISAQCLTLTEFDDILGTSSLKIISVFDDVLGMSSVKSPENNLFEFQIVCHCQNGVTMVLLVADGHCRQQQVTAW